jgi:hypothetical protein
VFAAINVGAAPLWLVYLDAVLWPTANLGVIAAAQTVAAMATLLAWKSTDGEVTGRALAAAVVTLAAVGSIVALDGPIRSGIEQALTVTATVAMAGGVTIMRLAMLEATHRVVTPANTVRAFTLLDVVASTSLQAGLLVSGFLITASTDTSTWFTDPYRAFISQRPRSPYPPSSGSGASPTTQSPDNPGQPQSSDPLHRGTTVSGRALGNVRLSAWRRYRSGGCGFVVGLRAGRAARRSHAECQRCHARWHRRVRGHASIS